MQQLTFSIENWCAWAPGLNSQTAWQQWAESAASMPATEEQPTLDWLPARQRRRLSLQAKMALTVAQECLEKIEIDSVRTIFASRHGEAQRMQHMLQQLAIDEPLSPTEFGLSVHNSTAGWYGVLFKDNAATTAIAAGKDTFPNSLIEAVSQLSIAEVDRVLLIFTHMPLPDFYQAFQDEPNPCFSVGMMLSQQSGTPIQMSYQKTEIESKPSISSPALAFIRFLLLGQQHTQVSTDRMVWKYEQL
ncbi:beta-ketoacyl synthase chain length factor [Endozoicomonas sp. SM1973]|uniref:Beta-ketoacyl synthase chain length factor n=1 Tax=Spartinivicinus marinus TaxID=2994442 RepID=A0A853HVR5_9GAMM|nr:beta-ketoacyl synthase chain length factor [Spartinivicinus marinus]MCX4025418.1 beta-ketoacyl synthase chain length factor [Spartinivicinus marinus]NYZ65353.1 beta-ketoacyl synthase chain length factor [Spartinivicinus marinus]